jgi:uncharacterized protein YciI
MMLSMALSRSAFSIVVRKAYERGELVLGGALVEPVDGAVLVLSRETVERFAETDPYVINGLVTQWRGRKWMTV